MSRWRQAILCMPTAVILFLCWHLLFYVCWEPLFYFYADSRPGTEKSFILSLFDLCRKPYLKLKLPVSFQVVQESFSCPCLQLQGLGFSELPELIFGFIFMFLVFLIYLELFCGLLHVWICLDDLFLLFLCACLSVFGRLCVLRYPYDPMM